MIIKKILSQITLLTVLMYMLSSGLLLGQGMFNNQPPCNCTANAGADIELCEPGGTVELSGSYTGNPWTVEWLTTPGLDNYKILNPNATVTNSKDYTLSLRCHTGIFATITNPSFTNGNSGFTSEYTFQLTPGNNFWPGYYAVNTNPTQYNVNWSSCGDHTSGNGNMLMMDGSLAKGKKFWCQTVSVMPNTEYAFEFWAARVSAGFPSKVQMLMEGNLAGTVDIDNGLCEWKKYTVFFKTGSNPNVELCLREITGEGDGNDFAIDDIVIEEVCRVEDKVSVIVNPLKYTNIYASTCAGQPYNYNNKLYNTAGSYKVPFKSWKSCDSIVTLNLEVIDVKAEINTPEVLDCKTKVVTLNGDKSSKGPNYSYLWTTADGQIDSDPSQISIQVSKAGTYTLTVQYLSSGLQCSKGVSIVVKGDYTPPVIYAGEDFQLNCTDSTVNLAGNIISPVSNYTIKWSTTDGNIVANDNNVNPAISSVGSYIMEVTDNNNGCYSLDTVNILQDSSLPVIKLTGDLVLNCYKDSIWLDASGSDNGGPYTFEWSNVGGSFASNTNSMIVLVKEPGKYQFTVTDTIKACTTFETIDITSDKLAPETNAGLDTIFNCCMSQLSLNGSYKHPNNNVDIQWTSDSGLINSGKLTLNPIITKEGSYYLKIKDLNSGCESTDTIEIVADKMAPDAQINNPGIINCSEQVKNLNLNKYDAKWIYEWSTKNGNIINQSSFDSITVNEPGLYEVKIKDLKNCCESVVNFQLNENKQFPVIDAGLDDELTCIDTVLNLNATIISSYGSNTIKWTVNNGQQISDPSSLKPLIKAPGTYYLEVKDNFNACVSIDSLTIVQSNSAPTNFESLVEDPTCKTKGKVSIVSVSGGESPYEYTMDSNNYQTIPSFSNLESGTYIFTVRDINGCEYSQSIVVPEKPFVNVTLPDELTVELGDSIQLTPILTGITIQDIASISWLPQDAISCINCLEPTILPLVSEKYSLKITDQIGCNYSAATNVFVIRNLHVYAPNAFSPDGDGINDTWKIFIDPKKVSRITKVSVFNRWGESLWELENIDSDYIGWDGKSRGEDLNSGVYIYYAEVEFIDGSKQLLKGDINLVR